MFLHYLFNLLCVYFMSNLSHCADYIFGGNLTRVIRVEWFEEHEESLIREDILDWDSGCEEFTVVYRILTLMVVRLIDETLELFFIIGNFRLDQSCAELIKRNITRVVFVHHLEHRFKILHIWISWNRFY